MTSFELESSKSPRNFSWKLLLQPSSSFIFDGLVSAVAQTSVWFHCSAAAELVRPHCRSQLADDQLYPVSCFQYPGVIQSRSETTSGTAGFPQERTARIFSVASTTCRLKTEQPRLHGWVLLLGGGGTERSYSRSSPPMYFMVISQWPHTALTMGYSFLPLRPRKATPRYWPSTTKASVPSSMSSTTAAKKIKTNETKQTNKRQSI